MHMYCVLTQIAAYIDTYAYSIQIVCIMYRQYKYSIDISCIYERVGGKLRRFRMELVSWQDEKGMGLYRACGVVEWNGSYIIYFKTSWSFENYVQRFAILRDGVWIIT